MKQHLILKMVDQHPDDDVIPHWLDFIGDKSSKMDRIHPELDRLFRESGVKVWITSEFDTAESDWSPDEIMAGLNRTYRIILQDEYHLPPSLIERIRLLPWVDEVRGTHVTQVPLPEHQIAQTASLPAGESIDQIYLNYARQITRGRSDVTIAVLDTGVDVHHPELQDKIGKRFNFVDLAGMDTREFIGRTHGLDTDVEDLVGHGTHVSGILAARGLQMDEGVCPDCKLMAVQVLATMKNGDRLVGAGIVDNINNGIKWAVDNGADVINMSLGIRHSGGGLPHEDVIRYAMSKGVTVVAASGNDGTNERYYPGALPGVIAVGAVDHAGQVTHFTSYGAHITVLAPGVNVYSSFAHGTYAYASGTSQASPFVAGMVGLMKSFARERGRQLSSDDIIRVLRRTSERPDRRLRSEHAGYGLINLADAFRLLDYSLN